MPWLAGVAVGHVKPGGFVAVGGWARAIVGTATRRAKDMTQRFMATSLEVQPVF
jgi:hypothetical protein